MSEENKYLGVDGTTQLVSRVKGAIGDIGNGTIILTSSSPLTTSSASNILGIECEGKSEQEGTPTPTNPIPIVDASGVVVAHNKYEYDGTLLQGYWDASSGQFVSNANNVCSADAIACEGKVIVEYSQTILRIAIVWYNGTTFIRRDNFDNVSKASADVPSNATHFKFNINTASAITPTSAQTITIQSASNSINIDGNLFNLASDVYGNYMFDDNGNMGSSANSVVANYIKVKPNTTYTLSFNRTITETYVRIFDYTSDKTKISLAKKDTTLAIGRQTSTFTTSANAEYIRFNYPSNSTDIMLAIGTVNIYYPYADSMHITLRSIDTVADTLVVNADGSGVLTKRVGTVDLGTLTWAEKTSSSTLYYTSDSIKSVVKVPSSNQDIANIKCEILVERKASGMSAIGTGTNYIAVATDGVVYASSESAPTSGKLYYPLATPTTTTLTSTQVASILALRTYNGTTIVDSEMDVQSVTYLKYGEYTDIVNLVNQNNNRNTNIILSAIGGMALENSEIDILWNEVF